MEALGGQRARRRLCGGARGRVLGFGAGAGLNLPSYPPGADLAGVGLSRMLARARRRAGRMGLRARLEIADIERPRGLGFPVRPVRRLENQIVAWYSPAVLWRVKPGR